MGIDACLKIDDGAYEILDRWWVFEEGFDPTLSYSKEEAKEKLTRLTDKWRTDQTLSKEWKEYCYYWINHVRGKLTDDVRNIQLFPDTDVEW